jgi:hypothetical protein
MIKKRIPSNKYGFRIIQDKMCYSEQEAEGIGKLKQGLRFL